ncbi:TetR/AcrR family transcriptional regulator [Pseudonocardia humida]|uniref:TetR/AcrR family transcriptional regulator n=1 Tax=Pseudonocardia humida TaxID=2800819 RepID=UPI00207C4547|nr:TetR family transcriptional regulator [Pseudonocardia humida]
MEAALRLVEREGVGAVTHRAVAREAGVAATAGTYHFPTVDDLLVAVITACAERFAAEVGERMADGATLADLAALTASYLREDRGRAIAEYEVYLLAARRPALRPAARLWTDLLTELLSRWCDDPAAVRAAVAANDGVMLQGLIADEPPSAATIEAVLRRALA